MLIYNLLEYCHNYSLTAESMGDYYEIGKIVFYNNASNGRSFDYEIKKRSKNQKDRHKIDRGPLSTTNSISVKYRSYNSNQIS